MADAAGDIAATGAARFDTISDMGRRYLRLHMTPDVGPVRLRNLLQHFGSVDAVLNASITELTQVPQVGPRTAESIFDHRRDDRSEREIERAAEEGVRILCLEDDDYPPMLKRISDPPTCLYVRGDLRPTDGVAMAIVGSRRCSHYGLEQARRFGEGLARAGFTIVSGLARGIDGAAHRAALDVGGRTLAVLGNGLATVYPPEHEDMAVEIAASGALLSELAVDQSPDAKNFPPRNRIIVGLCMGVLVIEASRRSGALISARLANDYNREVFALPGRVDQLEYSGGTNGAIREGWARPVTCIEDVLDDLAEVGRILSEGATVAEAVVASSTDAVQRPKPAKGADAGGKSQRPTSVAAALSPDEHKLVTAIGSDALLIDDIHDRCDVDVARIGALLINLELKGVLKRLPGNRYSRR